MSDGCSHAAWEKIGNANRCAEPGCRAWLTDTNGRTSTPAPAWEWDKHRSAAFMFLPVIEIAVRRHRKSKTWQSRIWIHQYESTRNVVLANLGPYPTAPEAARAAVEALRAIVEPVVEALDRVPELETP